MKRRMKGVVGSCFEIGRKVGGIASRRAEKTHRQMSAGELTSCFFSAGACTDYHELHAAWTCGQLMAFQGSSGEEESIPFSIPPRLSYLLLKPVTRLILLPQTGREDVLMPFIPPSVYYLCQRGLHVLALEIFILCVRDTEDSRRFIILTLLDSI